MTPNIQQSVVSRRTGKTTGISRSRWQGSIKSRFQSSEAGSVNNATITIGFGLIALIVVGLLAFFYLQQVVNTASQGTDVHALESQIVELREQQRELELKGAELRSLQSVSNRVEKLNLVTTDKVSYLTSVDSKVAVAK